MAITNVKNFSTEQLEKFRDELETDIARIKGQVENAKAEAAETGEYSDRVWFNRAKYALRMKGADHQKVLRELAARKKEQRQNKGNTVDRAFVEAARRRLDRDLFHSLLDEAVEEVQAVNQ